MKKITRSFSLPSNIVEILEKTIPQRKMSEYIAHLVMKDRAEKLMESQKKKTFTEVAQMASKYAKYSTVKDVDDILKVIRKGRK